MKLSRLYKFKENLRLYSILASISFLVLSIILLIMYFIYKENSFNIMIILIFSVLLLSISLEVMVASLFTRIKEYHFDDRVFTVYAGTFNKYLFLNDNLVNSKYDLKLIGSINMKYVYKDNLIEISISPIKNIITFIAEGMIIED